MALKRGNGLCRKGERGMKFRTASALATLLLALGAQAALAERLLVGLGEANDDCGFSARRQEARNGRVERQADDAHHGLARGREKALGDEGRVHGGDDVMLAVDERAVAVEDDEVHGQAYSTAGMQTIRRTAAARANPGGQFMTCKG